MTKFLEYLFSVKKLAVSTVQGYRSAIASVLGSKISISSDLNHLFKSFYIERPRVRKMVPLWNLPLVLESLKCFPYEPMHSAAIRFVTMKTLFLLALASGRRKK